MLQISELTPADRMAWEPLARGYKAFYQTPTTDAEFDLAWQRLLAEPGMGGLGARHQGRLVGIAHFILHASTWAPSVCYLQDLFVAPKARGQGAARALIGAVAERARRAGAQRYYWLTQEHNAAARALYDQVAQHNGFIRYDYAL